MRSRGDARSGELGRPSARRVGREGCEEWEQAEQLANPTEKMALLLLPGRSAPPANFKTFGLDLGLQLPEPSLN